MSENQQISHKLPHLEDQDDWDGFGDPYQDILFAPGSSVLIGWRLTNVPGERRPSQRACGGGMTLGELMGWGAGKSAAK